MSTIICLISSIALFLGLLYALLLGWVLRIWRQLRPLNLPENWVPSTRISILIPARNEADHIGECIQSVLRQSYPPDLMEILVIDDHSEDATARIVSEIKDPRLRLIRLADFPGYVLTGIALKKQALLLGIDQSGGEWIACTDADCEAPAGWLRRLAFCCENQNSLLVSGPVGFHRESNLLERFQSLDYLGMMLLTGAGVFSGGFHLSNGANLAYSRQAFREVGGFAGHTHLASGDDLLLSQKMAAAFPGRIRFLKNTEATVHTRAMPTIRDFVRQRLRWASKSGAYRQWRLLGIQGLVFVLSWALILGALSLPWAGADAVFFILCAWGVKLTADFFFLRTATRFFDRPELMRSFLPAQFLHVIYFALVGIAAIFNKRYEWKGRQTR